MEWYMQALRNWSDFNGRARRSEYWYFTLFNIIVGIVISLIDQFVLGSDGTGILSNIYSLLIFIPSLAVAIRRLHDTGRSGWWLLIALTVIGVFVLLYFYVQDSEPGTNAYGPNPKEKIVEF